MLTKAFQQLSKEDAAIAGGKGASLGEMTNAGIPVPPGYVVLSTAFDRFLEETDLNVEIDAILETVDNQKVHTVEAASEKIQGLILGVNMPEDIKKEIQEEFGKLSADFVAVRSSATAEDGAEHAWAGQLNSYLNTTEEDLLQNVQKCWASLFTPRAIFYRFEKGLHETHISVAVVVQKMIDSEKAGIAFSVHPVTEDFNQLIIEAGFGLGEAIVSGSITPDSYVVEKDSRNILDINVSTQTKGLFRKENGGNEWRDISEPQASSQVLSEKEIAELSDLIIKIENHYGFPCDIEWAYEGGKFYITQSRPITTLKNNLPKEKITLYNHQTREHSLFYASVWSDSNLHDYSNYGFSNIKNLVFQRDGKSDRLRVYYDSKEIEEINKEIKELANNDNNFFSKVEKDIKYFTDELVKYIDGKVVIENLVDLRLFYDLWRKWWTPMAVVFVIPSNLEIKEDIRNNALSIRQKIEKHSDNIDKVFVKFFQKYYPEYKEIASVVSANEVFSLASGKFLQDKLSEIRSRLDGGAIVNNIFLGVQELEKELEKNNIILEKTETDKSTDIIMGVSANAGNLKGRVRIVRQKKEIEFFEEGEILVTHMTSPDYLVAVKKAAAIITDEGGITCHAAIVARELKIPCIIGTKIATQVLKDGDLVEVDANEGVVRILERAKKEEYFKFNFPGFRYFMANRLVTTFKFNDFYLWGEIFGEYSSEGMHKTITKKSVFLEPGRKLFELLQNHDKELERELLGIVNAVVVLAKKLQEILYQDIIENKVSDLGVFFVEYESKFNKALAFGYPLDHAIDEYVKANPKIVDSLKSPYSSFLAEEEYELHEIFSGGYEMLELEEALRKHLAKYAWIKSDYQGENVLTRDDLYAKKEQLMEARSEKTKSIAGKNVSPKNLPEWVSLLIYLRDVRKKVGMIGVVLLDRYLKEECRKLKKDYSKARMLTVEEFENNKNGTLSEYPDGRREHSTPEGRTLVAKEEWRKFPFNQETEIEKKLVLSGVVANKGMIQGRARVIMGKHDFHKMKDDDIIVASMTRPEFMPILKKASAILTEQGGITCHAAIISRELNVPCIIGIENLVAIIKDGDLLEIDANKGVVKILEK